MTMLKTLWSAARPRLVGLALAVVASTGSAWATKIAVITPYLAQPGTQFYVEGFKTAAAKNGWDLYKIVQTIPGDDAFQSLAESRCPAVKK